MTIDIFFQGEHSRDIDTVEAEPSESVGSLKRRLAERHPVFAEALIFIEDGDEPIEEVVIIETLETKGTAKLHFHRCRHVDVSVTFAGDTKTIRFAPSATVGRVKRWAAEAFGLAPHDAGEHLLQIAGTHDRPPPGAHIGALVTGHCRVAFDLVPDERVNGASSILASPR